MLPGIDSSELGPALRGSLNGVVFCIALLMLERSADIFVDSTSVVARRLGLPTILVGLLTAGAEWEELAVVISSLSEGNPSLAVSNVIGSMTANVLGSFSIGLLFRPVPLENNETFSARLYVSLMLFLSLIFIAAGPGWGWILRGLQVGIPIKRARRTQSAGRWAGIVLLCLFVVYVGGIAFGIYRGTVTPPEGSDSDSSDSDSDSELEEEDLLEAERSGPERRGSERRPVPTRSYTPDVSTPTERTRLIRSLSLPSPSVVDPGKGPKPTYHHTARLIGSTLILSLSGYLLSSTTSSLAVLFGLSQSTLGLTLLSIATTLPEKLVAYKSGKKSQTGVLIANTVGSNVFLGTLVLGIAWTVSGELAFTSGNASGRIGGVKGMRWIWVDVVMVAASSFLMWGIVWFQFFRRSIGIAMLLLYIAYIVSVFLR